MRRMSILVILMLVGSAVPSLAQGTAVFYDGFESGDTAGWWAPARVSETGQVTCYDEVGAVIDCATAGQGQDGDIRSGVAWPNPRFVLNGNGTVTDMLTGLVWLRNADCFSSRTWLQALADANTLATGSCGLVDGSAAGDWRLPTILELVSLVDFAYWGPALSNAAGTGQWTAGNAFSGVQTSGHYWTSTSYGGAAVYAWYLDIEDGYVTAATKTATRLVWPVRGGL